MIGKLEISQTESRSAVEHAMTRPRDFSPVFSVVSLLVVFATVAPSTTAIVDGQGRVSYRDLAGRVAQLRQILIDTGTRQGDVAAVSGPRSADIIAVFLALESIGAVYLPLDTDWPTARIETVVRRAGAVLTVHDVTAPPPVGVQALPLPPWPAQPPDFTGIADRTPEVSEPRYVIFTSGTTGTPKGAVVEQQGMLNHLQSKVLDFGLTADDVVAFSAPLAFDISVWQMLIGLLVGATTVILSEQEMVFPRRILSALRDHAVTIVELVPTVVGWLTTAARRTGERLPALRWCVSTGEELHPAVAKDVFDTLPHTALMNAYGPTECSDDVTHHVVRRSDLAAARLPIGLPIANVALYVLVPGSTGWRAASPGEPGELFVGGVCVGAGYIAEPDLTAVAFYSDVLDPGSPTGRLYRTGDLAVFRDGLAYYLGRRDRQVKVAGVRMELDEIEAALKRHPSVAHCAVIAELDEGTVAVVAHYVTLTGGPLRPVDLTTFVGKLVPAAMVPKRWVHTTRLPMTHNGKVDHKALT